MDDSVAETKAAARRWTWRIPAYILLPFYLMLIGVLLRYAVYVRTTNHWAFTDYLRALCVYDCNAYERLSLNGYEGRPSGFDKGDANNWAFFPLYSIFVWAINQLTGLSMLVGGSILTSASQRLGRDSQLAAVRTAASAPISCSARSSLSARSLIISRRFTPRRCSSC